MANPRYDLVVIGSGPGGYVAAIRASQLKMKVAVVERDRPGGVCLNWGCIPSKALLNSAEAMETIRGASREHGIEVGEIRFDFKKVIARSRAAADKLSRGVRFLLRKNNIDLYEANGAVVGPNTVALQAVDGKMQSLFLNFVKDRDPSKRSDSGSLVLDCLINHPPIALCHILRPER